MGRHDVEFDEYVVAHWSRLVRAAIMLGCRPHEAEDLVQTVFTTCLLRWVRVRRAVDRDAYVQRILVNAFIDSRRRRWHGERPVRVLPERAVGDGASYVALRDAVDRSLGTLSTDQRIAVVLRFHLDLSEAQMATVLGVPPGTVKSRLSRALARLADDPHLADLRSSP